MRDEGDLHNWKPPLTPWGIAWRVAAIALTVYVILTAALVLTHG
jgi:hypothetical protein